METNKPDECAICLKTVDKNSDLFITKCGHVFHGSCMLRWASSQKDQRTEPLCPLCRSDLGISKTLIDFPCVTKKIFHEFTQVIEMFNLSTDSLDEHIKWMTLPLRAQQELTNIIEYHYYVNDSANNIASDSQDTRRSLRYNFSLSDLIF